MGDEGGQVNQKNGDGQPEHMDNKARLPEEESAAEGDNEEEEAES